MNSRIAAKTFVSAFAFILAACGGTQSSAPLESSADALTGCSSVGTTLVTTTSTALHSGPGSYYATITLLPSGTRATLVRSCPISGYYKLQAGQTGWVTRSALKIATSSDGGASADGGTDAGTGPSDGGTSSSDAGTGGSDMQSAVLNLINQHRAAGANCAGTVFAPTGPLALNSALNTSSQQHSDDMAQNNYFDHNSLNGQTPFDRMKVAGYTGGWMGENIAAGYTTPTDVVNAWMSDYGHCANIMNSHYQDLGVGYAYNANSTYRTYWTTDFGGH